MRAPLFFGRELVQQLRPFFFDYLAEIAGNFREMVSFKQELVQALKIFLHHDVIGDYPGSEDPLRSPNRWSRCFTQKFAAKPIAEGISVIGNGEAKANIELIFLLPPAASTDGDALLAVERSKFRRLAPDPGRG
jgi:hypothetical protein